MDVKVLHVKQNGKAKCYILLRRHYWNPWRFRIMRGGERVIPISYSEGQIDWRVSLIKGLNNVEHEYFESIYECIEKYNDIIKTQIIHGRKENH